MTIIKAIYQLLTGDSQLVTMLPGGIASVWTAGGTYPRMMFSVKMSRINNEIQAGSAGFEVYLYGNNQAQAETIRARLEWLLEKDLINTSETGNTLRLNKIGHSYIPDDNPEILHYSIQYELRAARIRPEGE